MHENVAKVTDKGNFQFFKSWKVTAGLSFTEDPTLITIIEEKLVTIVTLP